MKILSLVFLLILWGCSQDAVNPTASRTSISVATIGAPHGMNADRPSFIYEAGGVFTQPWGAAGFSWPKQLFWDSVSEIPNHYHDMVSVADGALAGGVPPLIGVVAWGFDYKAATGGGGDIGNFTDSSGYKQYASWLAPRKQDYWAQDAQGVIKYPDEGYVSFLMPMKPEDRDSGMDSNATFGDWAGRRIGQLANYIHCRGVYAADFFISIAFGTDYHPRVLQSFANWTAQMGHPVALPLSDVPSQVDYIQKNAANLWNDFRSVKHATFFASVGKTLLDSGHTPMVGGQISADPALGRLWGEDPRLWAQALPAKYWALMIEVQSAGDRNTPPDWTGANSIGATASYMPEMPIGTMLDADASAFWDANSRVGHSHDFGLKYLKHLWLTTGWTHVANVDGSVRRASQSFMRSFWDAGGVDSLQWRALLQHIPKHPFGPAMYYSNNLMRSFENPPPANTDTPNYYYALVKMGRDLGVNGDTSKPFVLQGVNAGYWVSDTAVLNLTKQNQPNAWIVYESNRLSGEERARLEAIAPVVDPERNGDAIKLLGPIHIAGKGLNALSFVDQNQSVILLVTNHSSSAVAGSICLSQVHDGDFKASGLLGAPDLTLSVHNSADTVKINVPGRETWVWEIPKLQWIGHE